MYTLEEIQALVHSKASMYASKKRGDCKPVNFSDGYVDAIEYRERISVHSDEDFFPEQLYKNRSPNQTQKELDYVKANHKAITYRVWDKFKSTINRIWNDKNWSIISWGDVDSKYTKEPPQNYFESEYPMFGSLEMYFKDIVTDIKEKDPNAVLVHYPNEIPVKFNDAGEPIFDDTKLIEPVAHIYGCDRVIDFKEGKYCLIELPDRVRVSIGKTDSYDGLVYEFYDDSAIYRAEQVGEKKDYVFDVYIFWAHVLGYLPCKKLKARPKVKDKCIVYKSHFAPACEDLDLALLDAANLMISKNRHVFPKFWEYASKCEFSSEHGSCDKGQIYNAEGKTSTCPSCSGSGFAKSLSPFDTIQIPTPDRLNPNAITGQPAGYIQPEIATPQMLVQEVERHTNNGLSILNLNKSNSDVKGGDTALGKQIDREEMFSFLISISAQVFDLFEFSLKTIQKMRYGVSAEPPIVSYPKNFAIRNEEDLTEEIAIAKEKGLPDIIIRELIEEYMATRFSAQENIKAVIDLVFYTDRLATLSSLEIANKKASGAVANWEDILHTSIYTFIEQAFKDDEKFGEQDQPSQATVLIQKAKDLSDEISGKKINADSVLANANAGGGVSDEEAKAKANLKGSVGGVQGLIQIQTSVSQGVTDYEAAVTMLFEIYGFNDDTARKLLGNPVDLVPTGKGVITE